MTEPTGARERRDVAEPTSALGHHYVIDLTDHDFDRVVSTATAPVVVDFWAPWRAPCLALAPTFAALAETYATHALFAKIRVDEWPRTRYGRGATHIPTILILQAGLELTRLVDPSREELGRAIEASLTDGS